MSTRDFVGYGPNPPVVEWPNGAKIAVSVVVNYEEGSAAEYLNRRLYQSIARGLADVVGQEVEVQFITA